MRRMIIILCLAAVAAVILTACMGDAVSIPTHPATEPATVRPAAT